MHKKSIEAAEQLKEEADDSVDDAESPPPNDDVRRTESIAALRAKALEHSARLNSDIPETDDKGHALSNMNESDSYLSRFELPKKHNDTSSEEAEEIDIMNDEK